MEVQAELREGYQAVSKARTHAVHSDEPLEVGGQDSAPTPSELLLSALASCILITCKMYAERKDWPLKELNIVLRIPDDEPRVIEKKMHFEGGLSQEQIGRLRVISGRCPVAKMLDPEISYRWID